MQSKHFCCQYGNIALYDISDFVLWSEMDEMKPDVNVVTCFVLDTNRYAEAPSRW